MANSKISALTSATTPVAGTEVLPIVQSSATKQVSIADLTAGRSVSMSAGTISSGNLNFSSTAQRITGDFSNATIANRLGFQSNIINGNTDVQVFPNGTSTITGLRLNNNSDPTNAGIGRISMSSANFDITSGINGAGTYLPIRFLTGGSQSLSLATDGTFTAVRTAGIGYGAGAGGTVTQGTSRTTGVTLSKPTGAITMFSAAGSIVAATFTVTNTLVAATDTIILNQKSGTNLYILLVTAVAAGSFDITFYTTGGIATDAPVINFSIIKGVTA